MPHARRRPSSFRAAFAAAALIAAAPLAQAADTPAAVKNADQYIAAGNPKAAIIELRNAVREAPDDAQLRVRLARLYLQVGDPVSAEREARAAREHNGAESDYLPVLADALLRQGKFAELSDLVRPGNRPAALESQVRSALGLAAAGLHDTAKAQNLLQDAIRLDPKAVAPKIALARLLARSQPAQAGKLLDEALAADPRSVEALEVKGELARAQGDPKAAMSHFDAALQISPNNAVVRLSRASLNIAEGNYKAANQDLDAVQKANPESFMVGYLRALEAAKQGQYAAADRLFDQLSPMFGHYPSGYYLQGATKFALGQYAQAETILDHYLALVPGDVRAARIAAEAALHQRAPGRAIDFLQPFAAKPGVEAQTLILLGNAYMAGGKPELALQQFDKAAAIEPNNPAIQTRMAISQLDVGQGKEGMAELEKVFDTEAGAPVAGPTLALAQMRLGHLDQAARVAAALVKRDAKNPLYLTLSGMIKAAQKDVPGAESEYRAALAQNPDFSAARSDLAALYVAAGRADDAKKLYQQALEKKADDETALLGLANVAVDEKKWPEAVDYINRARTAAPDDPAPGLALIQVYELQQDWANAKAVAGALNAQFPSDLTVLEAQAQAQLAGGDTNGAIASYKRAHELAPQSTPLLSRYLALLVSAGYYREASGVLKDAVDRDPRNAGLKADLIRVTAQLDGVDAAVSRANLYEKDDPGSDLYPIAASQVYENAGRWDDAAAVLEKALAARPGDDALAVTLARVYIRTGHFGKAEEVLTSRLKADPKSTEIRAVLGPLYLATGRTADAGKIYADLLAQSPNDVTGLLGLADVAIAQKKWADAIADIKRAAAAAPNDPAPGVKLVNVYIGRQDWKDAGSAAAALAAKFPTNIEVLDAQGRAQVGAGDLPSATATYKRAYELALNSTDVLSRYVGVLSQAKNYADAQSVLQAAHNRGPQNPAIKAELIRIAAKIGGVDAGLAEARDLAKKDPDNVLYDLVSADLLGQAGRGKEAIGLLERDLAAKPNDDGLITALARLYNSAGNPDKAQTLLKARLAADPSNYPVGSALASLYLLNKNYDGATGEYAKLLAARPADPAVLNNLAWLYQQKGDLDKARGLAERAVAAAPNAPQIDDTLGWILVAQGDAGKAVTYLTAASTSAPADPAIAYHLAVALDRVGRTADAQTTLEKLLGSGVSFADKPQAEKLLAVLKHS
jgi:putative PEP-CTERM system TPR-repeat lipoprotein